MTKDKALKMALEVMRNQGDVSVDEWIATEKAIKEALEQPEQPKVRTGNCLRVGVCASEGHKIAPQRKPLSDEEILSISADCAATHQHTDIHFARAIEDKLKDKNESKN
jgi:hypothetical protein